jgi:hypothetical protein
MEEDIHGLLEKNLELSKENNKLLKKMRRGAIFGGLLKVLWIAIIIGIPVYLYINFLAPVIDEVLGTVQAVQEVSGKVEGLQGDLQVQLQNSGIKDLLNLFNKK